MKSFRTCLGGLWELLRPIRGRVLVSVLIGAVKIAASLGFVWICKSLVDIVTGVSDKPLGLHVGIMAGIMVLQLVSGIGGSYWENLIRVKSQNSIREQHFAHVMRSTWGGREAFHSGDMTNRLEEDIRVVVDLLCTNLPDCIVTLCQLVAASVYLLALAPNLTWLLLLLMAVAVVGSKMFFRKLRELTGRIRGREAEIQGYMQENIQHRVLALTLIGVERVITKLGWLQKDLCDTTVTRLNYNAVARSFMSLGFLSGYAAAFLWGIYGIKAGSVTFGMMTAFLQLVGQVQRPVADISRHIPAFIKALTSVERLMELEELPLEEQGEQVKFSSAPGIRMEDVSFRYTGSEPEVLSGFSHDFKPGTTTVIMGLTGAGKSTLIRIVMALLKPSEGKVTIYADGLEMPVSPAVRGNYMYVPQGNTLMSGTIRENLLLADPSASEERMREALHLAAADFVFDLPQGLDTICSEKGAGLSEGQAQRIAIARALLHEGGVLILDEATSSLDAGTERRLLENVATSYRGSKTILFISHREAAVQYADDVLRL